MALMVGSCCEDRAHLPSFTSPPLQPLLPTLVSFPLAKDWSSFKRLNDMRAQSCYITTENIGKMSSPLCALPIKIEISIITS